MNVGAEPKKLAILGGLALVGYVFYANVFSSGDVRPSRPATKQAATPAAAIPFGTNRPAASAPNVRRAAAPVRGNAAQEFRPTLAPRPEDRPDYATIDPTLKLDLLAKVQSTALEGGSRSLFQFAAAPAPPPTQVAVVKPQPRFVGPPPIPAPPPPKVDPPPPPPPPITLKFFGFSKPRPDGKRSAFFLDGEEVHVAAEGELVKKRYRVVRIDANSVLMEDIEFKNNRQTLVLQPEQQQG